MSGKRSFPLSDLVPEFKEQRDLHDAIKKSNDQIRNLKPPVYENSDLKRAVDDLEARLSDRLLRSDCSQRRYNIAILVVAILTLFVTIVGVIIK